MDVPLMLQDACSEGETRGQPQPRDAGDPQPQEGVAAAAAGAHRAGLPAELRHGDRHHAGPGARRGEAAGAQPAQAPLHAQKHPYSLRCLVAMCGP